VSRGRDGYEVQYHTSSAARRCTRGAVLVATGRRANTAGFRGSTRSCHPRHEGEIAVDEFLADDEPQRVCRSDASASPCSLLGPMPVHWRLRRLTGNAAPVRSLGTADGDIQPIGGRFSRSLGGPGARSGDRAARLQAAARARTGRFAAHDSRGFIKLVADARHQEDIGAHILAPRLGRSITEPTLRGSNRADRR